MHTQALINKGPGETGFAPARPEVCGGLVNRVKEHITCKLELLWTVMSMQSQTGREDDSGQSEPPGLFNMTPSLQPSSRSRSHTGKIHAAVTRKCHAALLRK